MNDGEARAYKFNPVDNLKPLAEAKIPILCVIGDNHDWIVPIEENALLVEARYKKMGGDITIIKKPGAGHRPHSLADPTPIVDFVLKHSAAAQKIPVQWKSISARRAVADAQTVDMIPFASKADLSDVLKLFEAPTNTAEQFGTRVRGFIHPPKNGDYVFAVAADDEAKLYLSTDDSPEKKLLVASTQQRTQPRKFTAFPTQRSKEFHLEGGKKYYIEVVHREKSGGDHLSVAWHCEGVSTGGVIAGKFISPYPSGEKGSITREIWLDAAGWPERSEH
jgi:hypothetical protein